MRDEIQWTVEVAAIGQSHGKEDDVHQVDQSKLSGIIHNGRPTRKVFKRHESIRSIEEE